MLLPLLNRIILSGIFVLFSFSLSAQCIPGVPQPGDGEIFPDTLSDAAACQPYSDVISFQLPRDTTTRIAGSDITIPFNSFTIKDVVGLPAGMDWACDIGGNCRYDVSPDNPDPDTLGCVSFFGTPSIPGEYLVEVLIVANLELVGDNDGVFEIPFRVGACELETDCFEYQLAGTCAPADLVVNSIAELPDGPGVSIGWSLEGPSGTLFQSSNESIPDLSLVEPGQYTLNYEASVDTTGYILNGATLLGVDCTDLLNSADLYWKLKDPNGDLVFSNESNRLENKGDDLPLDMGLPQIVLDTGIWELEVWDNDTFGDAPCGSSSENVFFQIPALEPVFEVTNGDLRVRLEILNPVSQFGCSETITINAAPEVPTLLASDTLFCEGDSLLLMTESQDSLLWYQNDELILRGFQPDVWVTEGGFYRVDAVNASVCRTSSASIFLESTEVAVPQIRFDGDNLLAVITPKEELQYEWYNQEDSLVGTGSTFVLENSGEYYAIARSRALGCTSSPSSVVAFIATSLESTLAQGSVQVFPNPFREEIQLRWTPESGQLTEILAFDVLGKQLEIPPLIQNNQKISTVSWSQGLYTLVMRFTEGVSIHKVVKKP
ncbi:MAG: T9SS type A sorting domain-containing protein [Bacteroidota bacterium]